MKKLFLIVFSCLFLSAKADNAALGLLDKMNSSITKLGAYDISFHFRVNSSDQIKGYFALDGQKYYVLIDPIEIIFDGKSKYEVDHSKYEVNIDDVDPRAEDLLLNPSKILNFSADNFNVKLLSVNTLSLTPKDLSLGISEVIIEVSKVDNLPNIIEYKLRENGGKVQIEIEYITKLNSSETDLFRYDKKNYNCYEIMDFR